MKNIDKNLNYLNKFRTLKEHEKQMFKLIKKYNNKKKINVLDLGCADGIFLQYLSKFLKIENLTGVDFDRRLIKAAKSRIYRCKKNFFYKLNITKYLSGKNLLKNKDLFDVVILSGILSFFVKRNKIFSNIKKILKKEGRIYCFDTCIGKNIDFQYKVKLPDKKKWNTSTYIPSLKIHKNTVSRFFSNIIIKRFRIPIDIKNRNTVHSTYTTRLKNNERLIRTNYNLINEHYFLIAKKKISNLKNLINQ